MKPSILTVLELDFIRIHVDIDFDVEGDADNFDFEGALIGWDIIHSPNNGDENTWRIVVSFANSNDNSETKCPYLLDIQAIGLIRINDTVPENKERIVYENGAAIVYGAIREMVQTLTARCIKGKLVLPTPTFIGAFEEFQKKNTKKLAAKKKTKKILSADNT